VSCNITNIEIMLKAYQR